MPQDWGQGSCGAPCACFDVWLLEGRAKCEQRSQPERGVFLCRVPQLITATHVAPSPSPKSSLAWCRGGELGGCGEGRHLGFYELIKDNACF